MPATPKPTTDAKAEEEKVVLNVEISAQLNEKLRRAIFERYGMKQGSIRKAVEAALEKWVETDVITDAVERFKSASASGDHAGVVRSARLLGTQGAKGHQALVSLSGKQSLPPAVRQLADDYAGVVLTELESKAEASRIRAQNTERRDRERRAGLRP